MGIRQSLLALLDEGPAHGYQLKTAFEARTGGIWPLNVGQVYQTLQRLQRDGLVEAGEELEEGRRTYRITEAGRAAAREWFGSPEGERSPRRDDLAMKLLVALGAGDVDVVDVLQAQRTAAVLTLQEYTRLKAGADPDRDLPWLLVLDSLILQTEAEVRWLDACEARLSRAGVVRPLAAKPVTVAADAEAVRR
jgi:DNA-binding PadR family transcriptional regulator